MALLVKNLLFTVLVPGTVAVYIPLWVVSGRSPDWGFESLFAVAVLLLGAAIYSWCVWDFASFGRGTPAPIDAPQQLVVRGLYRYTRNPMYVGVLATILGWALLFKAASLLLYALAVAACFHLFVVLYEERHLLAAFGSQYRNYREQVPRWLPRARRRPSSTDSRPREPR
jgi:protein-S-isoprenylcysteine O-methyltransferase Ste14